MFFNEMVLPSGSNNHNHRHVVQGFKDLGYNVRCKIACASNDEGASAHNRWFMAASRDPIPSWDFHSMGGELKAPTPVCDVMLSRSATMHLEMSTSNYHINAPELVIELFHCSKDNTCVGVLPGHNHFCCVLLCWMFGKGATRICLDIYNLQDPAKRHLFVCLLNACHGDVCSFTLTEPSGERPDDYLLEIGYESGPRFQVQGDTHSSVSKSEITNALEAYGEALFNPDGLVEYYDPSG